MKLSSNIMLILAIAAGFVAGFVGRGWLPLSQPEMGTAILRDLSSTDFLQQLQPAEWQVLVDQTDDPFPPLSRNPQIARRIIAHAMLPESARTGFASRFHSAAEGWLTSHGAMLKGEREASHSAVQTTDDAPLLSAIEFPRYFYALGATQGVADFGCLVDSHQVTVVISIIEGH